MLFITQAQLDASFQRTQFGRREHPPVLPAYECWAPELGKPKAILRASNSFDARKDYAKYHQIAVTEVAARLMGGAR